jgi:hypothetical protein
VLSSIVMVNGYLEVNVGDDVQRLGDRCIHAISFINRISSPCFIQDLREASLNKVISPYEKSE